jgi:hypothetical protein
VTLYLCCVGSGKLFSKSDTYALCGVHDFCKAPPPPSPWEPLPTHIVTGSTFTVTSFQQVHRGFSYTLHLIHGVAKTWLANSHRNTFETRRRMWTDNFKMGLRKTAVRM